MVTAAEARDMGPRAPQAELLDAAQDQIREA